MREPLADWLVELSAADEDPVVEGVEPNTSERITLIEFLWQGRIGIPFRWLWQHPALEPPLPTVSSARPRWSVRHGSSPDEGPTS